MRAESEDLPTVGEAIQGELDRMAREGWVAGEVAGLPVRLREGRGYEADVTHTRLPSLGHDAIFIDGDPVMMSVSEVATWLESGLMADRTSRQATAAAKRLRRLALKAHGEAGRRFVSGLSER